jgi:hypothetical protein
VSPTAGSCVGQVRRCSGDHEGDPETYEKPLAKVVRESGADQDGEIVAAAKLLLERADPAGAAAGTYDLRGAVGVQAGGTGNTQTNTFSGPVSTHQSDSSPSE